MLVVVPGKYQLIIMAPNTCRVQREARSCTFVSVSEDTVMGTLDNSVYILQIGVLKQFTTSDGRRGQRLEVKLFDDSVSSFPLVWCVTLAY